MSFGYRAGPPLIESLSLEIVAGERVALLGPNGAGKSTLLRILAGSLSPGAGAALLDGEPIARIPGSDRARRVAFVPQESRIAFDFSVLEIVLMGRSPWLGFLGVEGHRDLERVHHALDLTDTRTLADRPVSQLSSGERQRVLLARALAQEAGTILLDEPTAFLDLGHQVRIHRLLERLNREEGKTIVFVSHDLNLAARHATRLIMLSRGRVVADGAAARVLAPETIRAVYGVEVELLTSTNAPSPLVAVLGPTEESDPNPISRRSP